jgi:hypothetical protein
MRAAAQRAVLPRGGRPLVNNINGFGADRILHYRAVQHGTSRLLTRLRSEGRMAGSNSDTQDDRTAPKFRALWVALSDIMGTSATATLLRRAAKHAATHEPHVAQLVIHKPAFEYEYVTPSSWVDPQTEVRAVRSLLVALEPLLIELTGEIVIKRLQSIPEVRAVLRGEEV